MQFFFIFCPDYSNKVKLKLVLEKPSAQYRYVTILFCSQNKKHIEALDDGQLKALLDEAINYKNPRDREGKSDIFKVSVYLYYIYIILPLVFSNNVHKNFSFIMLEGLVGQVFLLCHQQFLQFFYYVTYHSISYCYISIKY